jgi:molybdate transport system substrate-binding protein
MKMSHRQEDHQVTIRVFTSNSTHAVLNALAVRFERARGRKVDVHADSAKLVLERIIQGETADLAVLNAPDMITLLERSIIDPSSTRAFARSRIGVAVRAGRPHPDISTADALSRALLAAESVAHTVHGASGRYVPVLLERLGIAGRVKTVTRPGGLIGHVVATGEAAIAIQQVSELLAVSGIELVGLLPDEVQKTFEFTAGIFTVSPERESADAFLRFCSAPSAEQIFMSRGLEPA